MFDNAHDDVTRAREYYSLIRFDNARSNSLHIAYQSLAMYYYMTKILQMT